MFLMAVGLLAVFEPTGILQKAQGGFLQGFWDPVVIIITKQFKSLFKDMDGHQCFVLF